MPNLSHPHTLEDFVMALRGAARLQVAAHRAAMAEGLLWLRSLARVRHMEKAESRRFWVRAVRLFGSVEAVHPAAEIAWRQDHARADLHIARAQGDRLILQRRGGGQRVVATPLYPAPERMQETGFWRAAADLIEAWGPVGGAGARLDDPETTLVDWIHWFDPGGTVLPALARAEGRLTPEDKPALGHPLFTLWTWQWSDDTDGPILYPFEPVGPDTVFH